MRMKIGIGLGLTLSLLWLTGLEARASSCQAFFSQCSARCANNSQGHSKAKCTADHCSPKLSTCRQTGCWTEGKAYGGGKTCNLKK